MRGTDSMPVSKTQDAGRRTQDERDGFNLGIAGSKTQDAGRRTQDERDGFNRSKNPSENCLGELKTNRKSEG